MALVKPYVAKAIPTNWLINAAHETTLTIYLPASLVVTSNLKNDCKDLNWPVNLFFCSLINDAKKSVCIIDPYFDTKGLRIVEKINKDNIDVTIIISKQAGLNEHDIELFEKQYFPVRVFVNNDIHDRFIVMDNEVIYSNGTSFNYMGRKLFHVSRVTTDRLKTSILNIVNDTITK